jgi:hypothetical protein
LKRCILDERVVERWVLLVGVKQRGAFREKTKKKRHLFSEVPLLHVVV